jgi:4-amino-4-deoxy-L-arabinose transferase-like glycosyltransferase/membrane-associated phospholipid phosphatase
MANDDAGVTTELERRAGARGDAARFGAPLFAAVLLLALAALAAFRLLDSRGVAFCSDLGVYNKNPWLLSFGELGKPWTPLWLLLVWAWAANRPRMVLAALAAMGFVGLTVTPLKLLTMRVRPDDMLEVLAGAPMPQGIFHSYSFPSGDTALAFAVAVVAAAYLRPARRWLPYALAGTVALMRLLLLRHHVSDVLAGAALGLLCGEGGLWLRERRLTWEMPRCARAVCGAAAVLFPITDFFSGTAIVDTFLPGLGPLLPVVLLTAMGPLWLRWLGRKEKTATPPRGVGLVIALLLALAALPSLGWLTLYDRDEGYYVECGREMLERGEWFVPHFSGEPWMEKPPLAYLMMAGSMKLFGVTEFAGRLPTALCGILVVWLTFHLGRMLYGLRAGALAALAASTCIFFMLIMRLALVDMAMVAGTTLAMIGFWRLLQGERTRGPVVFYLGCGIGVLAKGPLGLALPVIALGGYVLWTRSWRTLWDARPFLGLLIVGAIACLWAVPATIQTRGEFLHELIWVRTIQPIFDPLQGHGGAGMLERLALLPVYIPVLVVGLLPWTAFLWQGIRRAGAEGWRSQRTAFLLGWGAAQLAVFSVISTKLPHYVLPIVPAAAILIGAYLAATLEKDGPRPSVPAWVFAPAGTLLACIVMAAPFATGFGDAWPWFLPPALVLVIGGEWSAQAAREGRADRLALRLGAVMALAFALLWPISLSRLETGKSSWRVALHIRALTDHGLAGVRVGAAGYREVSIVYYLRHPVKMVSGPAEVAAFLAAPEPALLVLSEKEARKLPPAEFAARRQRLRMRAWIAEKNQWTVLYLISNEAFDRTARAPAAPPPGRRTP